MICKRFSFIIICSVLSNITINSSWTTTSNVAKANLLEGAAIASLNQNSAEQLTGVYNLEHHDQIVKSKFVNQSESQPDLSTNSSGSEPSSNINRSWFLVAMAVTSTVYLCLLWILFRKPLPKNEVVSALANAQEQLDEQKVIDDLPSLDSVKDKEMISPQFHSGIDQQSQRKGDSVDPVDSSFYLSEHGDSGVPSSEIEIICNLEQLQINLPQDEPPLAKIDMSRVEKPSPRSNLVQINSNQDYIDVGFELIQDLHQGDRNIRRKAIWELAKIGDSRCIESLMAIMPQANAVDKSLIQKAITQINNRSFKPINEQLFASLKDANPQVRINTILDLTAFYKFVAPINQQLSHMQLDPDPKVRHFAKQALEKLNLTKFTAAVPMINHYPDHSDVDQNGNLASEDKDKANQI